MLKLQKKKHEVPGSIQREHLLLGIHKCQVLKRSITNKVSCNILLQTQTMTGQGCLSCKPAETWYIWDMNASKPTPMSLSPRLHTHTAFLVLFAASSCRPFHLLTLPILLLLFHCSNNFILAFLHCSLSFYRLLTEQTPTQCQWVNSKQQKAWEGRTWANCVCVCN